jgi:cytochrome c oxidase assembly factor CtaG
MVQHLLLLTVAAPLLAVGEPLTVMSRALPPRGQRSVSRLMRRVTRSQTSFHGWLGWTVVAFALSTAALAVWHVPALYDAAVRDTRVHVLEHATFIITATLFWWMALGASRRSRRGLGVLAVFVATLPASALGVLMTMARTPWYPPYGTGATALRSQQIAGAVMWGFGGSALVVAAAALFASWLTSMERLDHHGRPPQPVEPW